MIYRNFGKTGLRVPVYVPRPLLTRWVIRRLTDQIAFLRVTDSLWEAGLP
jgi:hypothetical protein